MTEKQRIHFAQWIIINIILPISPIGIKLVIALFSKVDINILDSVELVLYGLFNCIIIINMIPKVKTLIEYFIKISMISACCISLCILFIIYSNMDNKLLCNIYAICIGFFSPILAIIYNRWNLVN